jgi:hypothetical protein
MKMEFSRELWNRIHNYLDDTSERAIFLFVIRNGDEDIWSPIDDWFLDLERDYRGRSSEHVELDPEVIAKVIKRAHDMKCAVVEIHGHYWPGKRTRFSYFDIDGLRELVPIVLWRLPTRPYFALVVGPDSFDALAWVNRDQPIVVDEVVVAGTPQVPTGLSIDLWKKRATRVER